MRRKLLPKQVNLLISIGVLGLSCSTSNVIAEKTEGTAKATPEDATQTDASVTESAQTSATSKTTSAVQTSASSVSTSQVLPAKPNCTPRAASETNCADGKDDDCDGYTDCRDSECGGQRCGDDAELTCTAGACLSSAAGLPELPGIQNVRVFMNVDTARIEFEPIDAAKDYRIYPLPKDGDVLVGQAGEVVIKNAIYRCSGDRPFTRRQDDPAGFYDASLTVEVHGYKRTKPEALLGYVYTTPGANREAVYRVADPKGGGGHAWDYTVSPGSEYNSADYVVGEAARDKLLAAGYRDDGIAFYAPSQGTRTLYRRAYVPDEHGRSSVIYYTPGAEFDARQKQTDSVLDVAARLHLLEVPDAEAVPLYRVFYLATNSFDVLAAGEARYQRALEQGNLPLWSLTWPGLKEPTTLVIEALDDGCPFPNGYISASDAPGNPDKDGHYPSIMLDEARLASGEVYINGQHKPESRPRPIARAFVEVRPEPAPKMEFFEGFDDSSSWGSFTSSNVFNNGIFLRKNDKWVVEYTGCDDGNTVGPMLGQLVFGGGDYGSSCNMSIIPRGLTPDVKSDSYLHMRMTTEIPSSFRRYPQLLLTTTPVLNVGDVNENDVAVRQRLGPLPFATDYKAHSGTEHSIIVQPFGAAHELQIQFCDGRGWGVSAQCPRANIYGFPAGSYDEDWEEPWRPVPALGDMVGHDRPVRFDVYVSTKRVYVTLDGKPAACALLPEGRMPEGPVTPVFGAVIYHGGIDESVAPEASPHQYLRNYSLIHYDRKIDDVGIDSKVGAPPWDESVLPCAKRWYGAEE